MTRTEGCPRTRTARDQYPRIPMISVRSRTIRTTWSRTTGTTRVVTRGVLPAGEWTGSPAATSPPGYPAVPGEAAPCPAAGSSAPSGTSPPSDHPPTGPCRLLRSCAIRTSRTRVCRTIWRATGTSTEQMMRCMTPDWQGGEAAVRVGAGEADPSTRPRLWV